MFEQAFKNIDNTLRKEAGCATELDYIEQTSWILFLKYLDDFEKDRKTAAELAGKTYSQIIAPEYCWEAWAAPKTKDGAIDHNKAQTGDDLKEFVDGKLFPYLKSFKADATSADTIEYKIGEIFSELKNKLQSGYNLREVINLVDELRFRSKTEKDEMSHLYESKIKNMGNAGRNGGEYYTPRPLIKAIVKVVAPKIGDRIYDGAVGSAGFLCEAFEYLKAKGNLSTTDQATLQKKTFYGKEKKSLAYIIGVMNMILHGIEAPNIVHTNTLTENLADIQEKDRFDVVLANPPFGGKERKEVQQNFPIRTGETAFLFLQHFIKILKAGGRGGVVIKNTFLSNTDNASVSLRKLLLESCNLYAVLDCPGGTFQGAGVKTVVLFFEKGAPTRKVWYYQLDPGRNMGKTNPLNDDDLAEVVERGGHHDRPDDVQPVGEEPQRRRGSDAPQPRSDHGRDRRAGRRECRSPANHPGANMKNGWEIRRLPDIAEYFIGLTYAPKDVSNVGTIVLRSSNIQNDELDLSDLVRVNRPVKETLNVRKGDILMCSRNGSKRLVGKTALIGILPEEMTFGTFMTVVRSEHNPYLAWFFKSDAFRDQIGVGENTMINQITKYMLDAIRVPYPPLAEQRRIVGILDEAFEGLATAKATAEQNLQNARALFESHLQAVFTQRGHGWVEKKLSDVCAITSTLVDPRKKEFLDPTHVGAGNIESQTGVFVDLKTAREEGLISGKFLFDETMVLYSKIRPYLMKVARPDFSGLCSADMYPLAPLPNAISRDYLFHLLLSKDFTDYAVQGSARAGMPKVNREHLFEFKLWLPDLKKQKKLAANLDETHEETQRLESLYQRKLAALDELKKSLLHRAFSGELTKTNVIEFPVRIANITPTDLHAGIIAIAYQRHAEKGQLATFHHVKAEKIVHMVESLIGIELDRHPVKMAAGPNDFPRLKFVESRAAKANFFKVTKKGEIHYYNPGNQFIKLIEKTKSALGEKKDELYGIIDAMVPWDTTKTEILATTFAAWNNLLIDGFDPDDKAIVFEARENWHPNKLEIEGERFFGAIKWMRKKNLIPLGRGRKVIAPLTDKKVKKK